MHYYYVIATQYTVVDFLIFDSATYAFAFELVCGESLNWEVTYKDCGVLKRRISFDMAGQQGYLSNTHGHCWWRRIVYYVDASNRRNIYYVDASNRRNIYYIDASNRRNIYFVDASKCQIIVIIYCVELEKGGDVFRCCHHRWMVVRWRPSYLMCCGEYKYLLRLVTLLGVLFQLIPVYCGSACQNSSLHPTINWFILIMLICIMQQSTRFLRMEF